MKGDTEIGRNGPTPHRKALTRQRIVRAATDAFALRGFERTSIARIAKQAGVSPSAVFWHFGDKQSLFGEVCGELLRPYRDAFQSSLMHEDPEKRLLEIVDAFDRFAAENRDTIHAFVRWLVELPELRDRLHRSLLELHAAFESDVREVLVELLPPGHDAGALASGLLTLLDGTLVLGLVEPASAAARRRAGLAAVLALVPKRRTRGG